jgi:ribosomal protein RSM22 (predicted rRNA methylase)
MELQDLRLSGSSIARYIGIDKRDGLTSIGKRLVNDIDSGDLRISWQRAFQDSNKTEFEGRKTLALSAFVLSSLPTSIARKLLVKEMWESGAEVMVLIDHKTALGFEAIAQAREYLLKLGKKELEDAPDTENCLARKGSHVVAPVCSIALSLRFFSSPILVPP